MASTEKQGKPLIFTISSALIAKHGCLDAEYYAWLIAQGDLVVNDKGEVVEVTENQDAEQAS